MNGTSTSRTPQAGDFPNSKEAVDSYTRRLHCCRADGHSDSRANGPNARASDAAKWNSIWTSTTTHAADLSDNKKAVNLRRESAILLLRLVWRCSAKCANCLSG